MLVPIFNSPRDYAWGSPTLLPDLTGRPPTGAPEAEIWYGDHAGSPSTVVDGSGRTLDQWLRAHGEAPLPFLMKLLAAGSSLSIQVHPSKEQAGAGFGREEASGVPRDAAERTYRDDNHKPEIIVALSDVFRALVGLRPLAQTRTLLAALGDRPGIAALMAHLDSSADDGEALRGTLEWLLTAGAQETVDDVCAAVRTTEVPGFAPELAVYRRIADEFPGDAGVVVAVLMNVVELRRGEALFAPAGVLHSYQDGLGVEVMAASDNVLRGGLTPKHIDVPELMRVVDTTPAPVPVLVPADGRYDVGIPDFAVLRVAVQGSTRVDVRPPAIALVVSGEVTVSGAAGESHRLQPAHAVFADTAERTLLLSGDGEVFIAQPGSR
ncbi:mannose-6-phosphate isomerase, class I [Microbacterium sp. zg.Y1090]|uniref:mannose-6-phosphate isomerase, class I n=1 Tax=Microbacterium TaxID=33882 RepID=UPI00214C3E63|nr:MULTISPECIES: mannose-6-phosphate isomerase, class I [unclassified Microbacterium]MCR2813579.1 mannose-6-phosphate isomerase, class I [Microbacterium sp. zg.Y1084]MCR2818084.1 mannose-6-phosphate isomerase, class I [Microbacterium sp. zg.Y1090]WIM27758.1 mannose-6-phosphate isomerase, class I [Microbacterium sp. zg-Y1090]